MPENKILHKELSYKIVGCFFNVFNELGPAHKEQIYHKALCIEFKSNGIAFSDNKKLQVKYKDQDIGVYQPDFVVEDKIIVEIKSTLQMPKVFEKQLYYYLRGTKYNVGYLVNFGSEKLEIRRRIYDKNKF